MFSWDIKFSILDPRLREHSSVSCDACHEDRQLNVRLLPSPLLYAYHTAIIPEIEVHQRVLDELMRVNICFYRGVTVRPPYVIIKRICVAVRKGLIGNLRGTIVRHLTVSESGYLSHYRE